jgi:hypothetical protein
MEQVAAVCATNLLLLTTVGAGLSPKSPEEIQNRMVWLFLASF